MLLEPSAGTQETECVVVTVGEVLAPQHEGEALALQREAGTEEGVEGFRLLVVLRPVDAATARGVGTQGEGVEGP